MLVCIDSSGKVLFDFTDSTLNNIAKKHPEYEDEYSLFESCDGLNVTLCNDVWVYWYENTDSDTLIKIKDFQFEAMYTDIPSFFYYEFAVYNNWLLFSNVFEQKLAS